MIRTILLSALFCAIALFCVAALSKADAQQYQPKHMGSYVADGATEKECSKCHPAIPPMYLPTRSWRAIMAGLSDHFGEKVEISAAAREQISAYLTSVSMDAKQLQVLAHASVGHFQGEPCKLRVKRPDVELTGDLSFAYATELLVADLDAIWRVAGEPDVFTANMNELVAALQAQADVKPPPFDGLPIELDTHFDLKLEKLLIASKEALPPLNLHLQANHSLRLLSGSTQLRGVQMKLGELANIKLDFDAVDLFTDPAVQLAHMSAAADFGRLLSFGQAASRALPHAAALKDSLAGMRAGGAVALGFDMSARKSSAFGVSPAYVGIAMALSDVVARLPGDGGARRP